jgi:uncharacterized peroxidase-related enzyme
MAHIKLHNENLPGIVGLLDYSPQTAKALSALAEILLADDNNSLSKGEREIIAASVSHQNDCHFCHQSHAAAAASHLNKGVEFIDDIKKGFQITRITDKLKALLTIAHHVQRGGKHVTADDIKKAKQEGATDKEIHDTVLISAAFCMYNRYVDGLGTWAPKEDVEYMEMGRRLADFGYANASVTN